MAIHAKYSPFGIFQIFSKQFWRACVPAGRKEMRKKPGIRETICIFEIATGPFFTTESVSKKGISWIEAANESTVISCRAAKLAIRDGPVYTHVNWRFTPSHALTGCTGGSTSSSSRLVYIIRNWSRSSRSELIIII